MIRVLLCCSISPLTSEATSAPRPFSTSRVGTNDINPGGSTSSTIARAIKLASKGHTFGVSSARSSMPLSARMNPSKNCSLPYTRVSPDSSKDAASRSALRFSSATATTRFTTTCPNRFSFSSARRSSASRGSGLTKNSSRRASTFCLKTVMARGSLSSLPTRSTIVLPTSSPTTRGTDLRKDSGRLLSSRKCAIMCAQYSIARGTSSLRSSSIERSTRSTPASTSDASIAPRTTREETIWRSISRSLSFLSREIASILRTSSGCMSRHPSSSTERAASRVLSQPRNSSEMYSACWCTRSTERGVLFSERSRDCRITSSWKAGETRPSKQSQSARVRSLSGASGQSRARSGRPTTARVMPLVSCMCSISPVP
mmetsp:Transcript_4586/g.11549  ORF Transcript_4586/g.11549 Transcript_4586/m.11549 type:complete len:372 (+) Transcript_4586:1011-2126(+)